MINDKTEFSKKVIALIKKIPKGKVATYGQIAKLAGKAHGARGVGWLLHSTTKKHGLPWQRVLNSRGMISFPKEDKNHALQQRLLKKEGVHFVDGKLDMAKYQWQNFPKAKKSARSILFD